MDRPGSERGELRCQNGSSSAVPERRRADAAIVAGQIDRIEQRGSWVLGLAASLGRMIQGGFGGGHCNGESLRIPRRRRDNEGLRPLTQSAQTAQPWNISWQSSPGCAQTACFCAQSEAPEARGPRRGTSRTSGLQRTEPAFDSDREECGVESTNGKFLLGEWRGKFFSPNQSTRQQAVGLPLLPGLGVHVAAGGVRHLIVVSGRPIKQCISPEMQARELRDTGNALACPGHHGWPDTCAHTRSPRLNEAPICASQRRARACDGRRGMQRRGRGARSEIIRVRKQRRRPRLPATAGPAGGRPSAPASRLVLPRASRATRPLPCSPSPTPTLSPPSLAPISPRFPPQCSPIWPPRNVATVLGVAGRGARGSAAGGRTGACEERALPFRRGGARPLPGSPAGSAAVLRAKFPVRREPGRAPGAIKRMV